MLTREGTRASLTGAMRGLLQQSIPPRCRGKSTCCFNWN